MKLVMVFGFLILASCASGHCRKPQIAQKVQEYGTTGTLGAASPGGDGTKEQRAWVFKYDGSLQCKMGKTIALADMKQELRGIPVFNMEKKHDGQMHIQACGSLTGQTNVYEISSEDVKEAEKRGFKVWSFK